MSEITKTEIAKKVDSIQKAMLKLPQVDCPLTHQFTTGMYIRTAFFPKGTLVLSRTHKVQHPFTVHTGKCTVWDEFVGISKLEAGHLGITKPGTRRLIYAQEDTKWTCFFAGDWKDKTPEQIIQEVSDMEDVSNAEDIVISPNILQPLIGN